MAATNDLIYSKLIQRYPTEGKTVGDLLRRYKADNSLFTYEDYRNHVTPSSLYVDGSSGAANNWSTPDHASFALTDLDVRALLSMEFWGPIFLTAHIVDQGDGPPQNSWTLSIHPNSRPRTALYDGTNIAMGLEANETLPRITADPSTPMWLRSTSDVNNGAGGKTTTYYTAEYDGTLTVSSWDQLGDPQTESGAITFFNSTSPIRTPGPLALSWVGRLYYVELRSGIDGSIVANPDFRNVAPGQTSLVDSTGKTWTMNGTRPIVKDRVPIGDAENLFWANFVP